MKDVGARGYSPLYVKSFVSKFHAKYERGLFDNYLLGWRGEEGSMAEVFGWARQMAPCVIILEGQ